MVLLNAPTVIMPCRCHTPNSAITCNLNVISVPAGVPWAAAKSLPPRTSGRMSSENANSGWCNAHCTAAKKFVRGTLTSTLQWNVGTFQCHSPAPNGVSLSPVL